VFKKILVANRGEIACRVMRTARRLGITVVAVYSDADAGAPHVQMADEAVNIGPAPATESYLRFDRVIAAARSSGAEAIHPGYGFLSENAQFADALENAGIAFIGPTSDTIRAMGSKAAAKTLMANAGVPVLPGYQGDDQSPDTFAAEARRIGYPVLLKASAGGGGKGMRLVEREEDLRAALESARREALSAFGDDGFIVEKYLAEPRHIEVQIFGDGKGQVVHVFERDCSVQRRHQKIIEEAPAPRLPANVRNSLLAAGVQAGMAIDYRGAGTVEFLYDGGDNVYFMEMNTRLQVEHPVSEEISGLDFVEWQLRIAAGEGLPLPQARIRESGHAFESRLYAEDPDRDFAPATGTIEHLDLPRHTRVDSGIERGQLISPHYDPMIAKLITHGPDRETALDRMAAALAETRVAGLETNARFLHALATDTDFAAGMVSTRYIEDHRDTLFKRADLANSPRIAAALKDATGSGTADDPWESLSGWRSNRGRVSTFGVRGKDGTDIVEIEQRGTDYAARTEVSASAAERRRLGAGSPSVSSSGQLFCIDGPRVRFKLDDQDVDAIVANHKGHYRVWIGPEHADVEFIDLVSTAGEHKSAEGSLEAPMPGVIVAVTVEEGDTVKAGDTLLVLEAMKMEHQVHAPGAGIIQRIRYRAGDQVSEGDLLVELSPE
jgi:3-methylcrotonyl-CoA carboxylase alpha subunit